MTPSVCGRLGLIVLSVVIAACPAAPALASTVAVWHGELTLTDAGRAANAVSIEPGPLGSLIVTDDAAVLTARHGCGTRPDHEAGCLGPIFVVRADLGAGDDSLDAIDLRTPVGALGGPGDDALAGGGGADDLDGGAGDDSLSGAAGADRLAGGDGDDLLYGGNGPDTLLGDAGSDILNGGLSSGDVLIGGDGPDLLRGGGGADVLEGDAGDDLLAGDGGANMVDPGAGTDEVLVRDSARDEVDCQSTDRVRADDVPAGCTALRGAASAPRRWPALTLRASTPTNFQSRVSVVTKRHHRKYWLEIRQPTFISTPEAFAVVVKAWRGHKRVYRRCFATVWSEKKTLHRLTRAAYAETRIK